jgi:hypothetical protein
LSIRQASRFRNTPTKSEFGAQPGSVPWLGPAPLLPPRRARRRAAEAPVTLRTSGRGFSRPRLLLCAKGGSPWALSGILVLSRLSNSRLSIMSMKQPGLNLRPVILSGIETTIGSAKQCSANKSSTTRGTGRIEFDTLWTRLDASPATSLNCRPIWWLASIPRTSEREGVEWSGTS